MQRRVILHLLGGSLFSRSAASAAQGPDPAALTGKLEAIRQKHGVPALAAARFDASAIVQQTATGFRKAGGVRPVTTADLWHLGSMTKAMTATLLATYVGEGRLDWEDTLGKLIPKACEGAAPGVRPLTVRQLLQHRSGLPANLSSWWDLPAADQRDRILRLAAPVNVPLPAPGQFLYSNVGYAIAGHIAEILDGEPWEDLMEKRVFRPLKISAGQGPAGKEGSDDQPWPHDEKGRPLPLNGLHSDNPPSLGPAGRVHASMENYARFAADHLQGACGQKALLKPALYQTLHHPAPDSHYACGWASAGRPWAGGRCLTHTGSNNANFFAAWLAPEKSFGVAAACNQGGSRAAAACDEACSLMIHLD